jgi:hypothetical protein
MSHVSHRILPRKPVKTVIGIDCGILCADPSRGEWKRALWRLVPLPLPSFLATSCARPRRPPLQPASIRPCGGTCCVDFHKLRPRVSGMYEAGLRGHLVACQAPADFRKHSHGRTWRHGRSAMHTKRYLRQVSLLLSHHTVLPSHTCSTTAMSLSEGQEKLDAIAFGVKICSNLFALAVISGFSLVLMVRPLFWWYCLSVAELVAPVVVANASGSSQSSLWSTLRWSHALHIFRSIRFNGAYGRTGCSSSCTSAGRRRSRPGG